MAEKRRIVICNDGTWNSPDDEDRGKRKPTNITKISRAVLPVDRNGVSQIVYYDEGVGTGWGEKVIGGITGLGLSANVIEAYRFLSNNYHEGDELFLFGFSRGAYTVRSLCGLITKVGLLAKDDAFYLSELYEFYRNGSDARVIEDYCQNKSLTRRSPRIKMLGVFDTVGALGIPFGGINRIISGLDLVEFQFHDVELSPIVDHAYHALAIDEKRVPFEPTLWRKQPTEARAMEQRWFVGVHSNIGGGYDPDGLANLALGYMVQKAKALNLEFDDDYLSHYKGFADSELRNSMTLKYKLLGEYLRPITLNDASHQTIDDSVMRRIAADSSYRPENVPS